jgi:hypothetical protein
LVARFQLTRINKTAAEAAKANGPMTMPNANPGVSNQTRLPTLNAARISKNIRKHIGIE